MPDALYLGVDVVRGRGDPPPGRRYALRLDNEPDDLNADGAPDLSAVSNPEGPVYGFLVVLASEEGGIRVTPTRGSAGAPEIQARFTGGPYSLTYGPDTAIVRVRSGDQLAFDLI